MVVELDVKVVGSSWSDDESRFAGDRPLAYPLDGGPGPVGPIDDDGIQFVFVDETFDGESPPCHLFG
jgi:hypothetical protein